MKNCKLCLLVPFTLLLAGCTDPAARSISHSTYQEPPSHYGAPPSEAPSDPAFEYRGELSEFDVLGISRGDITSDAEIRRTLDNSKPIKLRPGSSVLLIQSGALLPDGPMVAELSKHFTVVPFSGVPALRRLGAGTLQTESFDPETYAKSLRLTAARGGTDFIVCYWGMLESETDRLATKTVSWVPIVHWVVPDEKRHLRIRLKLALIDVRSGNWSVFSPKPFEDARLSTGPRRDVVDQKQVEQLKKLAYESAAAELVRAHSEIAMGEH
jgi:hypothetical protein